MSWLEPRLERAFVVEHLNRKWIVTTKIGVKVGEIEFGKLSLLVTHTPLVIAVISDLFRWNMWSLDLVKIDRLLRPKNFKSRTEIRHFTPSSTCSTSDLFENASRNICTLYIFYIFDHILRGVYKLSSDWRLMSLGPRLRIQEILDNIFQDKSSQSMKITDT